MFFLSILHAGSKTRPGLEKALENFRLALTRSLIYVLSP